MDCCLWRRRSRPHKTIYRPSPPAAAAPPPPPPDLRPVCLLSDDLIELCILPLLPVRSLLRFQSVSRRWHHLVADPHFTHLHANNQRSLPPGILYMRNEEPFAHRFLDPETNSSLLILRLDQQIYKQCNASASRVVASCSGFVCALCHHGTGSKKMLVVGNPLMRDWKLIPNPPCISDLLRLSFGLAVDLGESHSDVNFKLVLLSRREFDSAGFDHEFHVFTSSTGLWEAIQQRVTPPPFEFYGLPPAGLLAAYCCGKVLCVRGILYWMCSIFYLLRFDLKDKQSRYEALPPSPPTDCRCYNYGCAFGEWNGELSYIRNGIGGMEIWSMTDHRKPGWIKRHSLSFDTGQNLCFAGANLLPFFGGDVMFWIGGMLYRYNVKTGQAQKLVNSFCFDFSCFSYKPSLAPLPNLEDSTKSIPSITRIIVKLHRVTNC